MNNKNNIKNDVLDIKQLLSLADIETMQRDQDTCRLYDDGKINFASNSGIVDGKRYAAKIANNIMVLYADEKNGALAHGKGNDGVIINAGAKIKNNASYRLAYNAGKKNGSCKDYTMQHHDVDDVEYITVDLLQHHASDNAEGGDDDNK